MRTLHRKLASLILLAPAALHAADFYVSPSGSQGGNGSQSNPWDLRTALAQPASVHPGDTIWVHGGTYNGAFDGALNGTASAPIVVRNYPGERPVIVGNTGAGGVAFGVDGSYAWYWGFEIMNSPASRYTGVTGSGGLNGWGVVINGPYTKLINCIIHDTDQGISSWSPAAGSEMTGNIIYNNGWLAPDRGHGHGIYAQNQTTTKKMIDNIIFNQYSHGIHAYTQGGSLNNLDLEGNTSFNNGTLEGSFERNILVGGYVVVQNPTLISNFTYFTPSADSGENNMGYAGSCTNAVITNNYLAGGTALHLENCPPSSMTGNTLYDTVGSSAFYPNNTYYTTSNPPTGTKVFIRPNAYESGRANVTIFNWAHATTVAVDLSTVLTPGTPYVIRDAENFNGAPVVSGTYAGGTVNIPMTGLTVAAPIAGSVSPAHTGPEFGVFVVLPVGSAAPPPDTIPPTVSITAPSAGQTVSGTTTVSATASDNVGVVGVQFKLDGGNLGAELSASPYSISWTTNTASNGLHTITAVARDAAGNKTTSAPVQVTVSNVSVPPPTTASAAFVSADTNTKGNWEGVYGADGYDIATLPAKLPAYAQVTTSATTWVWASSTTDTRGLEKPGATDRIASTWYNGGNFTIDLNLTDGAAHRVALYQVDWDNNSRTQTVDILDASSGALLDSRQVPAFTQGEYLVWNISGHVTIRATQTGGSNAVVSALFFGGAGNPAPPPSSVSAVFNATDTATQGNWEGVYGADGYDIATLPAKLPAYAQVTTSATTWVWASSTTDTRGLQKPGATDRIASTWYNGGTFTIDLNLTDGAAHRVALYQVDWDDSNYRAQTIDILNASTGQVLDTRSVSNFAQGEYLVWTITGHVTIRVTQTGDTNCVVSALFFGGGTSTPPPPSGGGVAANFVQTDTTTQGSWKSVYGGSGYAIASDSNSLPSFAKLSITSPTWVWAASTTDVRALQSGASNTRIASTWYDANTFNFDLNLTDGSTHQVAVYAVDWFFEGRSETVQVLNAATGAVLDSRSLSSYVNGVYLVWNVSGHVKIEVTSTSGPNGCISGVFIK